LKKETLRGRNKKGTNWQGGGGATTEKKISPVKGGKITCSLAMLQRGTRESPREEFLRYFCGATLRQERKHLEKGKKKKRRKFKGNAGKFFSR